MCGRGGGGGGWGGFEMGQIHTTGLFSLRRGGPPQMGLLWGSNLPNTFQVGTCRASPIDTSSPPSLEQRVFVGRVRPRQGKPPPLPSKSKRSSVHRQPSLYSQRFCLHGETTTKSWDGIGGPGLTPHRSERLKFCFCAQRFFCVPSVIYSPDASPSSFAKGSRRLRFL